LLQMVYWPWAMDENAAKAMNAILLKKSFISRVSY